MAITITDKAKDKIRSLTVQQKSPHSCLHISLRGGGCSGFMYEYKFISKPNEKDKTFQFEDVKICIDTKSYFLLNGLEIDYEEDLFKSGLIFNAPSATTSCGCGESISFSV